MDRGHPVRQRAQPAHFLPGEIYFEVVRAARSGGQDVRGPLVIAFLTRKESKTAERITDMKSVPIKLSLLRRCSEQRR
jgi:hypothetical protein